MDKGSARVCAQGVRLTEAMKLRYRQYWNHKANGMADDLGMPGLLLRHQYALLERASRRGPCCICPGRDHRQSRDARHRFPRPGR